MPDRRRSSRRLLGGRAEWNLRGAIHKITRTNGGGVQVLAVDKLGNAVTINMPAWQAKNASDALAAAAQPKENPNA
ncbi:hypothetical protein [Corynebacterium glyciniphilum]|uniref:hypothetical protein n=1 Tax=Corynebacterium glyciniphilum TaxID=1404244 RepID=UPI0011AB697E|nr:hypothetical protein [Corynebacterium glyciniphilum]